MSREIGRLDRVELELIGTRERTLDPRRYERRGVIFAGKCLRVVGGAVLALAFLAVLAADVYVLGPLVSP